MKKVLMIVCAAVLAGSTFVARADHPDMPSPNGNGEDRGDNPLARGDRSDEAAFYKFSSMVAVDGAFVGTTNPIRGLVGDATPRSLFDAHGSLSAGGRLHIEVQGLVAANETSVPAASQGVNEQASFRGLVSCLSEATDGTVTTVNVMTDPFPATPGGRANIQGSVALPAQCIAPVVFVTSAAGDTWLAVVGIESTSSTTTP